MKIEGARKRNKLTFYVINPKQQCNLNEVIIHFNVNTAISEIIGDIQVDK